MSNAHWDSTRTTTTTTITRTKKQHRFKSSIVKSSKVFSLSMFDVDQRWRIVDVSTRLMRIHFDTIELEQDEDFVDKRVNVVVLRLNFEKYRKEFLMNSNVVLHFSIQKSNCSMKSNRFDYALTNSKHFLMRKELKRDGNFSNATKRETTYFRLVFLFLR